MSNVKEPRHRNYRERVGKSEGVDLLSVRRLSMCGDDYLNTNVRDNNSRYRKMRKRSNPIYSTDGSTKGLAAVIDIISGQSRYFDLVQLSSLLLNRNRYVRNLRIHEQLLDSYGGFSRRALVMSIRRIVGESMGSTRGCAYRLCYHDFWRLLPRFSGRHIISTATQSRATERANAH